MQKQIANEALALRKVREILGLDRKQAGMKLSVSYKTVEKFENGRSQLSPTKVGEILRGYEVPQQDYLDILAGRFDSIREKYAPKRIKIIEHNRLRRSYKREVTKDVLTLIALRKLRGFAQQTASLKCGYARCTMGHIENGRIELPPKRIEHIVKSYGFAMSDFNHHKGSEVFVTDIQDECIKVIRGLPEEKLKAVFPLLKTFHN